MEASTSKCEEACNDTDSVNKTSGKDVPRNTSFHSEEGALKFVPPVYIQRYISVIESLGDPRWRADIHKVVDMGCSELGFFVNLKNFEGLREIVAVDIDVATLEYYSCKTAPLTCDYLKRRDHDLVVTVLAGSVAEYDKCLKNSDAVICIELIEHLYPLELEALPYNIFGQVKPRVAIFTTPNADFNVLFPNFGPGFRHYDHKFEWTREQFESWAVNLSARYPEYKVEFKGIGPGPGNTEITHGCCSQMAVFWREGMSKSNESEDPTVTGGPPTKVVRHSEYRVIRQSVYPACRDERSPQQIAQQEAEYAMYILSSYEEYEDAYREDILIPLSALLNRLTKHFTTEEELKIALKEAGKQFETNKDGIMCVRYVNKAESSEEDSFQDEDEVQPDQWTLDKRVHTPDSDWDMTEANPRAWQSEPHLQASSSQVDEDQKPPEPLMFRSVNERQIFGLRASSSDDPVRVDDSGYPNSASVQDMDVTLGSSDELSNSPSDEEEEEEQLADNARVPRLVPSPPPPQFRPAAMPANNHDAVNNNRDGEGNDLGFEAPHQPRPGPRPPQFPRWLLYLLAQEHDEGYDFSSSDEEEDEDDDDRHIL